MLQRAKVSWVGAVVGLVVLFLCLQYLAAFKDTVKTTQKYTLQMQAELRQAMEEQRGALEEARQEDSRHLEAVLSDVEMRVAQLLQSQARADNTVAQQLETVVQQLRSALSETDRVLGLEPDDADDTSVADLAYSQEQLISTIDLLLISLDERHAERARESHEREAAVREVALPPPTLFGPETDVEIARETEAEPEPEPEPEAEAEAEAEAEEVVPGVDYCVLDDADEHSVVDLANTLLTTTHILPSSARAVEYFSDDVFSIPVEELFGSDEYMTMIYRLGFPSTSSSNLRSILEKTAELTQTEDFSKRLVNCPTPTLVGCAEASGGAKTKEEAMNHFRKWAGKIYCPDDPGQHMAQGDKERLIWEGVDEEDFNLDVVLRTTMLREPSQYANRIFSDKRNLDHKYSIDDLKKLMGITSVSGTYLFFDMSFEERTYCSLEDATLEQWINLAHWRWNYFVRGMADDYSVLWLRFASRTPGTREQAWALNEEGQGSPLLAKAIDNLHSFPFFGIYDRLDLSMELFAFTFCVDYEALGFKFKDPIKVFKTPDEHLTRGADLIGEEAHQIMRDRNRLDFLFFEYAEQLFDERVAAMREAKERGYRCKLADSSCGIVC